MVFLEMMPLMGFVLIAVLNWQQFIALFGFGQEPARFCFSRCFHILRNWFVALEPTMEPKQK